MINKNGIIEYNETIKDDIISINGKLNVVGDIICDSLTVNGRLNVTGNIKAKFIMLHGKALVQNISSNDITINGSIQVDNISSSKVYVEGNLNCQNIESIDLKLILSGKNNILNIIGDNIFIDKSKLELNTNFIDKVKNSIPFLKDLDLSDLYEKIDSKIDARDKNIDIKINTLKGNNISIDNCYVESLFSNHVNIGANCIVNKKFHHNRM